MTWWLLLLLPYKESCDIQLAFSICDKATELSAQRRITLFFSTEKNNVILLCADNSVKAQQTKNIYIYIKHAHLWSKPDVVVPHKAGVGVVLDVLALDVVLQVEERLVGSVAHLYHTHLHDVHLRNSQTKTHTHTHTQFTR